MPVRAQGDNPIKTQQTMENPRVLFISQEISPFMPETEVSKMSRDLPNGMHELGIEVRLFMPRFGCVNERRNQLHEVIRLSGMNLVIDGADHPLIIKVASMQNTRMQVYFIDNEDYFHRKEPLIDPRYKMPYLDNDERSLFFCKGVLETVKKLRWSPDVIHCHGWMSAFAPLLIKKAYADDPLLAGARVVYSIYNDDFEVPLSPHLRRKMAAMGIARKEVELLKEPNFLNLTKLAIKHSDAVITCSRTIDSEITGFLSTQQKLRSVMDIETKGNYIETYSQLYNRLLIGAGRKRRFRSTPPPRKAATRPSPAKVKAMQAGIPPSNRNKNAQPELLDPMKQNDEQSIINNPSI